MQLWRGPSSFLAHLIAITSAICCSPTSLQPCCRMNIWCSPAWRAVICALMAATKSGHWRNWPPTGASARALIHVGGEILTCNAWQAAVMLLPPEQVQDTVAYLDARPRAKMEWVRNMLA